jgi:hypothetical protein
MSKTKQQFLQVNRYPVLNSVQKPLEHQVCNTSRISIPLQQL